ELVRDAPGILGVKGETLNVLREAAVASRRKGAGNADGGWGDRKRRCRITHRAGGCVIKRQRSRDAAAIGAGWIDVAIGVRGIGCELLCRCCERAAEHRLVNEVDSELERMVMHHMAQVVAELIFVLVAEVREKSDRGGELIVAEGLEPGNGERRHAEGELYGEAQIRIP